jgi:hypothetical protein
MYQKMIEAIYNSAAAEAAQIAANTRGIDTETPFRFDDYPQTRKRVAELMARLKSRISVTVVNGIDAEWTLANNKNNELANRVFGDNVGRLSQAAYRRYYSTNDNARQAFQARKVSGLNLSERVWMYAEQFKQEIEMGLDVGLRNGLSADEMSRDLRSYLRHPDKLFRRVRDERGQLHLSKAAAAYHPGRGVYRSSYMNARRLAATETNIAYRTSDHLRWQQMDFVVGIEIRMSNNHPVEDICDELAGRYPKDFKFTGWHPFCRCHAVAVLKTEEEMKNDTQRILDGEEPLTGSVNEVKDFPLGFKGWIKDNKVRISAAEERGTLPYFIRDNREPIENIRNLTETEPHYGAAMKFGRSATKEVMKIVGDIGVPELTEIQRRNIRELADVLSIPRKEIKPMSFLDADQGASNPSKDENNCQSVVVAFEARRRGLDCHALPYNNKIESASYILGERFQDAWINAKTGKIIEPTILRGKSDNEIISKFRRQTSAPGRYILGVNDKDGRGHVVSVERLVNGKLIIRDEQKEDFWNETSMQRIDYLEVLRIDKAMLNIQLVKSILGLK